MKKYIALFLAVLMLVFVGCTKTPEDTSTTGSDITTTEPESTTEYAEPLSYDEFFSEVRPYEIKYTDYSKSEYPDTWDKNLYISSNWGVAQNTNRYTDKWGSHTSEPYKYDGEFREDRLYLVNRETKTVEGFFSDCNIYHLFNRDAEDYVTFLRPYLDEYACRKEGVYAVVDHNELDLLNYEGKKVKTIYTSDSEIFDFYVLDSLAWVFSDGTIYRIYLPTGDVDKIIEIDESSKFIRFYYPISNFEVQWEGKDSNDVDSASFYYNAKTGESKKRVRSFKGKNHISNGLYQATGWWFVPEDSYKMLEKIKLELPEGLTLSPFNEYLFEDLRVTLNCGGSLAIHCSIAPYTNGFVTVNYDFKPVFRDGKLVGVENIPSWYKLNDFVPFEGNDKIVITDGEYAKYYEDFDNYRFAFVCEGEDEPVYAVIIPKYACSAEAFEQTVKTISIEK